MRKSSRSSPASAFLATASASWLGDPFLPSVDGGLVSACRESLEQPHEDQEVDGLGQTVNQLMSMVYFPVALSITWCQNGLAKIKIIEITRQ